MPFDTLPLISEVYRLSNEKGLGDPPVTRLVKILYLADLEWRRSNKGEPLSNWSWKFWLYGPYAPEIGEVFGSQEVESVEFKSGKACRFLIFKPSELRSGNVPNSVSKIFNSILERWGGVDLNDLLDYVYFETEPMENATRGQLLDFSPVPPRPQTVSPTFDTKKLSELRRAFKKRVEELSLRREVTRNPLSMMKGEEVWKEEFEPV
jgi:hypothetical protein